jgi:predicted transcriptional regulator
MHSPVATISAQDIVRRAVDIMKETGYSQLPVLIGGRVVGSVQEATLLDKVAKSSNPSAVLSGTVYNVMDKAFKIVEPNSPLPEIIEILSSHEPAVLVMKDGQPYGIVTKIDVISFGLGSGAGTT